MKLKYHARIEQTASTDPCDGQCSCDDCADCYRQSTYFLAALTFAFVEIT